MVHFESSSITRARLDRLLRPRSIALVGASSTPGSLGECVFLNLQNAGYAGDLHLINPKRPLIHGRECLASIDELPVGIDCAVLAIPGTAVLEAARACGRKQVGSLIIFSAGFAESGEAGKEAQCELKRISREYDMMIEGPNCLGMVNYAEGIPLTFVVTPPQPQSTSLGAAILSQSGALAAVIAVNMRHHGVSLTYSISTGNEASHGVEDFLEYLIGDQNTRVIALVVEQFLKATTISRTGASGSRSRSVRRPPPSRQQQRRAGICQYTHRRLWPGTTEVMHTLVTHAGVIHVKSLEELVDVSQILVRIRELPCKGSAVFTESGAFKALILDLCEDIGLDLPCLSPAAESALREALPAFIPPSNPLDLTAQGLVDPELYSRTLPAVLEDPNFGSVLLGIILTDPKTTALKLTPILHAIRSLQPRKTLIFAALDEGAPFDAEGIQELRAVGVPCFPSPERALRALARVTWLGRQPRARVVDTPPRLMPEIAPGVISEHRAKALLKQIGIPIPQGALARSLEDAVRIARSINFPVVLKAQAIDLPHKSDVGGVILSIENENSLAEAWFTLHRNIKANRPGLELEGVLVQRMGRSGSELILGARSDPEWGPVLLAGSGGVLAEVMRDVRLMPADLSILQIGHELGSLQCSALFQGFRGAPPLDIDAAAQILFALGQLIRSSPEISEIDINPVVVYPKGAGAVALGR